MKLYFVGAGPGDPDLITVKGKKLLMEADLMVYAGSLVNPELLTYAKKDCVILDSAAMTLEDVIAAMETAEKLGSIKAQNIVLLGALVKAMGLDGVDWKALVSAMVPPKAVEMNLAAYDAGYNME